MKTKLSGAYLLFELLGAFAILTALCLCPSRLRGADHVYQPTRTFGAGSLESLDVSSDGRHLVTGGSQGVFLWDIETGTLIRTFVAPISEYGSISDKGVISRDNKRIATAFSNYNTSDHIHIWDIETGQIEQSLEGGGPFGFSPDGSRFFLSLIGYNEFFVGDRRLVQVWDLATRSMLKEFTFKDSLRAITVSGDGRVLAVSEAWVGLHLIDLQTGGTKATIPGDFEVLAISPEAETCVTGRPDGYVKLWSVETGELLIAFGGHNGPSRRISALAYSQDGQRILSGTSDGDVKQWRIADGALIHESPGKHGSVWAISTTVEGERAFSVYDGLIRCWDIASDALVQEFRQHNGRIQSVSVSLDQTKVISGGGAARVWDVETGNVLHVLSVEGEGQWQSLIHPDGQTVVLAGSVPRLWNLETGELIREYRTDDHNGTGAIAMSADGNRIAAAHWPFVSVWDMDNADIVQTVDGNSPGLEFLRFVHSISLSPDGTLLLVNAHTAEYGNRVHVVSVASGQVIHQLGSYRFAPSAAFSPDGQRIVTAGDNGQALAFWDAQTGDLIHSNAWGRLQPPIRPALVGGPGSISSISFSPDGKWVVVTSQLPESCEVLGGAWIFDSRTGEYLRFVGDGTLLPSGHWQCILGFSSAAFSPNGQWLVTGSDPGTISIWDLRDLRARPTISSNRGELQVQWDLGTLQFSPSLNGPWTDLPAASPLRLATIGAKGFFRVKVNE
jgi:WD40 repeat protein